MSQAEGVFQRLLLSGANLPDAQDGPGPSPTITSLSTLWPVTDKPPDREKTEDYWDAEKKRKTEKLQQQKLV